MGASSAPPPKPSRSASAPALLDLDALWCRYGLAGCVKHGALQADPGQRQPSERSALPALPALPVELLLPMAITPQEPSAALDQDSWVTEAAELHSLGAGAVPQNTASGPGRFAAELPQLQAAGALASRLGSKLAAGGHADAGAAAAWHESPHPSSRLLAELSSSGSAATVAPDSSVGDMEAPSGSSDGGRAISTAGSHVGSGAEGAATGDAVAPAGTTAATTLPGLAGGAAAAAWAAARRIPAAAASAPGWALLFLVCKTAAALAVMQLLRRLRQRRAAAAAEQAAGKAQPPVASVPAGTATALLPQGLEQACGAYIPAQGAGQAAPAAGGPAGQAGASLLAVVAREGTAAGTCEAATAEEPASRLEERSLRQQYGSAAGQDSERHGPVSGPEQAAASCSLDSEASGSSSCGSSLKNASGSTVGDLSVDASVRLRDISLKGWVQTPARSASSSNPSFVNPLFSGAAGEQAGSPGGSCGELPSPSRGQAGVPGAPKAGRARRAGSSTDSSGGGTWQVKQAAAAAAEQVGRGRSESLGLGTEDSFRLLAAELPARLPGSPGRATPAGAPAQPGSQAPAVGAGRRASCDAPRPGSPAKGAARGASRKLTGARSIAPWEASLLHPADGVAGLAGAAAGWADAGEPHCGGMAADAGPASSASAAAAAPGETAARPAAAAASRRPSVHSAAPGVQLELSGSGVYEALARAGTAEEPALLLGSPSRPTSPLTAGMRAGQRGLRLLTARQLQAGPGGGSSLAVAPACLRLTSAPQSPALACPCSSADRSRCCPARPRLPVTAASNCLARPTPVHFAG